MSKISLWKALQNLNLLALKLPLRLPSNRLILLYFSIIKIQGRILRFWKGVALYIGHYDWSTKKILGFSWSKKAKIMLETISFWQNISVSIFKFSPLITADNPAINWYFLKFKNLQKFRNHFINYFSVRKFCRGVWNWMERYLMLTISQREMT